MGKQAEELEAQRKIKAKEQEKLATEMLAELKRILEVAEAEAEKVREAAEPLTGQEKIDDRSILQTVRLVEELGKPGCSACQVCVDYVNGNRLRILEAENMREESTKMLQLAQPRITAATQKAQDAMKLAKSHKDRIANSVGPPMIEQRISDRFKKYDKDEDGVLRREEIIDYSWQEFNFEIPTKNVDRIFHQLVPPGAKGVASAKFQQLKTAVGIARFEGR